MSELRWTLLILGVVFIAALSWWERRRPRQAFAPRLRDASLTHEDHAHADAHRTASTAPVTMPGEPWIGEAGLSEAAAPEITGIRPLEELPTLVIPDTQEQLALRAAWDDLPAEPALIERADTPSEPSSEERVGETEMPLPPAATRGTAQAEPGLQGDLQPHPRVDPEPGEPECDIPGAEGVGAVRIVEPVACAAAAPPEPLVEWPPEESRRILALRLVAPQPERFPGRTLRLAMAAEGFLLGKFSIFHKPDEANRAVLSAASLTRPGSFDLETMDSQRYVGLSLFAVLPGPKAPPQAFEELLATARNLNERLQGALQDERGGPLTSLRVASIRDDLRAEAATLQAAAAHEA
ncbi:MAG TPA: cell division protein ZipA C-terminal FtsZ-binding domain-containing protein [Steroidobacteraceae bacterium]|jgi:cell division protein ZipA|nr:cell division protein ZipA C-terminal FtsZ-binding domain-containing protein [Steroidobacteraceae bacterium]